ncbi:MAG: hypothetical protein C4310_01800, partial [Chloroflexota bacterium]
MFSKRDRTQLQRDCGVTFGQELAEFQAAPGGADVVREGFLAGRNLEPASRAMMLSRVDDAARTGIVSQLQRTHGNAYVQRLIADIAGPQRPGQVIQRQGDGPP